MGTVARVGIRVAIGKLTDSLHSEPALCHVASLAFDVRRGDARAGSMF